VSVTELPDGSRVTASYDWSLDRWTITSGDRTSEGRTLYGVLRDLLDVRSGTVSPDWLIDAVKRLALVETPFGTRVQCRCCGYLTLESYGHYEICSVCNWEDDPTTIFEPDEAPGGPGPNHISLSEGRENFDQYGISKPSLASRVRVRDPFPEECPPDRV
jgi:hypothetical protein